MENTSVCHILCLAGKTVMTIFYLIIWTNLPSPLITNFLASISYKLIKSKILQRVTNGVRVALSYGD